MTRMAHASKKETRPFAEDEEYLFSLVNHVMYAESHTTHIGMIINDDLIFHFE